jgi:uncharacterized tellurite resistance protein B-like protein
MADLFDTTLPLSAPSAERLEAMKNIILEALSDDQLTQTEMKALSDARVKLGLSSEEVRSLRHEIVGQVSQRINADGELSSSELELLNRVLRYFNNQP